MRRKGEKKQIVTEILSVTIETLPKDSLTDYQTQGNLLALHKCSTADSISTPRELLFGSEDIKIKINNLKKLIKKWNNDDPHLFALIVSNAIGAQASIERVRSATDTSSISYYLVLPEYSIRIGLHNLKAYNYTGYRNRPKNYGVTLKKPSFEDTFESQDGVRVKEFVYEYWTKDRLKHIAESILFLLENGYWNETIAPADYVNPKNADSLGRTRIDDEEEEVVMYEDNDWDNILNGVGETDLQISEMRLVNLDIIKDFGEKIGGSAKDRYTRGPKKVEEKDNKKRLPTYEEALDTTGVLRKTFQPSVEDFERLGFNKVCSRLMFFWYYMGTNNYYYYNFDGVYGLYYSDVIKKLDKIKAQQDDITESYLEYKSEKHYKTIGVKSEDGSHYIIKFSDSVCQMTILSMNLEKGLGEDFDYNIARKIPFYGDKKQHIHRWHCWSSAEVSVEAKQKLFNLEYEYVRDGKKPLAMIFNTSYVAVGDNQDITFYPRSGYWRWNPNRIVKVFGEDGQILSCDSWEVFRQNYADWLILGRKQYDKLHENDKEEWEYKDKAGLVARDRKGEDWRKGRNAEPQDFLDVFGFRAVEFGETMPQKERWLHANWAYDSFMDLAKLLNVSPKCMSLGGRLALCFGSRGRGGKNAPMAHFEPKKFVINLTRKMGAGSLAHEWFHAFDNSLLSSKDLWSDAMGTDIRGDFGNKHKMNAKLVDVIESNTSFSKTSAFQGYEFRQSAVRLDSKRSKKYWSTNFEMYARAFEYYVDRKLKASGLLNEYLVQLPALEEDHIDSYPYPHPEDRQAVIDHFDRFWAAVSDVELEDGTHTIK